MVHPLDENKDLSVYVQLLPVAGRVQKWALILNYRHRGGTNPNTKAMFDLPLLGTELDLTRPDAIDSGVDESNTPFWGHAHPVLLRKMDFDAIRFSGISSNRSEWPLALNFSVTDGRVIGYVKAGGLAGLDTTFQLDAIRNAQLLPGHTSDDLPRFADKGWRLRDIGDEANMLLAFPFYKGGDAHWSIRGQGRRWEVSDYEPTERFHTHHQVWIGLQKYLN
jgi:hypothetical protein